VQDEQARKRLAEERERLVGVRATFDDEHFSEQSESESVGEISSYDQHQADMGTETFEREKDLSILEQVEAELADVEFAIRRLDEGTYGTCEVCGRAIPEERLEVLPATRLCLEHQAQAEREVRASGERAGGGPVAADGGRGPGQARGFE
jgi:RNA polymerase-binding transcription factor DksA